MVEDGVGVLFPQVAGLVSSGKVAGPVVGGTAQTFAGFETDLRDVDATQFGGSLRLRRRLILTVRSVYTFHAVQLHSFAVRLLCLLDLLAV